MSTDVRGGVTPRRPPPMAPMGGLRYVVVLSLVLVAMLLLAGRIVTLHVFDRTFLQGQGDARTLRTEELLGLEQRELLYRLYHEETVRVFEPKPLHFGCSCSRERLGAALLSLGAEELHAVLAEQGEVATQCHFCHTRYRFTPAEIEALLSPSDEPPTLH